MTVARGPDWKWGEEDGGLGQVPETCGTYAFRTDGNGIAIQLQLIVSSEK